METNTELIKKRIEKEVKKTMQDLWNKGFSLKSMELFAEMIKVQVDKEIKDPDIPFMKWNFLKVN